MHDGQAKCAEGQLMPPTAPLSAECRKLYDEERKYLETLMNARLNFYLVFSSLLLVALFNPAQTNPTLRLFGSLIGVLVSVAVLLAVWRTHRLVSYLLDRMHATADHPYAAARRWVESNHSRLIRRNANEVFAAVPIVVGVLFVVVGAVAAIGSS